MLIKGFSKLTLLDYPGKVAATVFTGGCNFRCPFCHNASLVERAAAVDSIPEDEVISTLSKRVGILDGVCITGGEPTLLPDLPEFIAKIKALGYAVKLDTNGTRPEAVRALISQHLVDKVAVDIKNSPEKYALTVGHEFFDLGAIRETVKLLMESGIDYEFRTTAVHELHTVSDFTAIGEWIAGAKEYYIQCFKDSGDLIGSGLTAPGEAEMAAYLNEVRKYVSNSQIRGM